MKVTTVLIIAILYLILVFDFHLKFTKSNTIREFNYQGLLWVGLDYYSIWKYNSRDVPMKWIEYTSKPIDEKV